MWNRVELKANAKLALKNFYWKAVLACLIVGLLTGSLFTSASSASSTAEDVIAPGEAYVYPADEYLPVIALFLGVFFIVVIVSLIVGLAYNAFIGGPVEVGGKRYFMENRSYPSGLKSIFFAFNCGKYGNVAKTMFLRNLYISLWSLLFIIPGIVKNYEYYMIPYIMAENPGISSERAFMLSKQMTQGRKMDLFIFDLSFFGWELLGALLLGIGIIFVNPYIEASRMELYYWLRSDALYQGYSDPSELCDVQYPPMA